MARRGTARRAGARPGMAWLGSEQTIKVRTKKMKTFKAVISGPALLMHNGRLANPRDPYTKALKALTAKKKKSDEDHEEVSRAEFQGGLYHDDDIGPYIPGDALQTMLVEGSRKAKQGREFVSVSIEEDRVPLEYKGPRDREGLWADDKFVFTKGVKVTTSRVMRTRPLFRNWKIAFTISIEDDATVNPEDVERALTVAGRMVGIGDWRPGSPRGGRHGRFAVESFTEVAA